MEDGIPVEVEFMSNADLVQLATRAIVLEETVLKLTSALEELRTLLQGRNGWGDGGKEDGGHKVSDFDLIQQINKIIPETNKIRGEEVEKSSICDSSCDPDNSEGQVEEEEEVEVEVEEEGVGIGLNYLQLENVDLLQPQEEYDQVLIDDIKSEAFDDNVNNCDEDEVENGIDFVEMVDFDGHYSAINGHEEDSSQPMDVAQDGDTGIRTRGRGRANRTKRLPQNRQFPDHYPALEEDVSEMDKDHDSDSDYQPSASEDNQEDPLIDDCKSGSKKNNKAKKMIKILPSSNPEATLPNPYIPLGPRIKKTKPPKQKRSSSRKKLPSDPNNHTAKKLSCQHCDYSTNFRRKYNEHLRKHTGERPFLCETCGKGFRGKDLLVSHMKSHDPSKPIHKCDICGQEFRLKFALIGHVNRVHKDPRRQCDICKGIFACNESLYSHKLNFHGDKNAFICEHCGHGFATANLLMRHVERHSDPNAVLRGPKKSPALIPPSEEILDPNKIYVVAPGKPRCEVEGCGKTFGNKILLDYHTRMDHMTEEERKVKCQICHRIFKDIIKLKCHMNQIHTEERPHICNICGQAFKFKQHLKRHVTGHSNPNWKPRANCKPKTYPAAEKPPEDELGPDSNLSTDSGSNNLGN